MDTHLATWKGQRLTQAMYAADLVARYEISQPFGNAVVTEFTIVSLEEGARRCDSIHAKLYTTSVRPRARPPARPTARSPGRPPILNVRKNLFGLDNLCNMESRHATNPSHALRAHAQIER